MSPKGPAKMDVRTAWEAWTTSGSAEGAEEFLGRVGPWTEGTAAQIARAAARQERPDLTIDHVADRLRYHLGVVAGGGGEPITYMDALDRARSEVIAELRRRPPR